MRSILENRSFVASLAACVLGYWCFVHYPFPVHNPLLGLVRVRRPGIFAGFRWSYTVMLFTTPYLSLWMILSLGYTHLMKQTRRVHISRLPTYPEPGEREQLYVVVGEIHHPKKAEPVEDPHWLAIPERGLYAGTCCIGAVGSGKTTGVMYPYAEQILGYAHKEKERRASALVLEVKGDFCHKVQEILARYGRSGDYMEISLDSDYRYNPLHNNLSAYAQAYGIASLMNSLWGRGKDPFWQQAYTNLVKFVILLHKTLYGYVTLFDVYECIINHDLLAHRIEEGERILATHYVLVPVPVWMAHKELDRVEWVRDESTECMRTLHTDALESLLKDNSIEFQVLSISGDEQGDDHARFQAVKRWFRYDWIKLEPKLRTSIVEGISSFFSLFDDNPAVKYTFCPPKELYDEQLNVDGKYGLPLPPLSDLIEQGKVLTLNFPVGEDSGLARIIGTLLKVDFQRSVLGRIPKMEADRKRVFRPVLFLCDEYHVFATVGETDPSGDEKFFALSRQAKCIPVVATQSISSLRSTLPGESWRTLLQTFRTKIFLALSDPFSAEEAARACGKEMMLRPSYSISESSHHAEVSMLTGRTTSQKGNITANKSWSDQKDFVFEGKVFAELKNAESIVLAYDGANPQPATRCYLKPYYLRKDLSYFEQLQAGLL